MRKNQFGAIWERSFADKDLLLPSFFFTFLLLPYMKTDKFFYREIVVQERTAVSFFVINFVVFKLKEKCYDCNKKMGKDNVL